MLSGIAAAIAALLLAALLAALLRVPVLRAGLADRRRARPVPLLGGAAVVAATCSVVAVGDGCGLLPDGAGAGRLAGAAAVLALLGGAADVWRLRTRFLALGTAVAAAWVVPYDETGVPAGLLAVVWIVAVTLAFKGLDHADGLAGTVGVVTAFGVGACAAAEVLDGVAVLLSVLAAALTGFLMHNWHPARIALGACGSLFTGFLLASAAVLARSGYGLAPSAGVLFALTAVAGADALLVVAARRLGRRPLRRRAPDHLAHRLRRLGLTEPGASVLLGTVSAAGVVVGVLAHGGWIGEGALWWVAGGALALVLALVRVPVPARRGETALRLPGGPRREAVVRPAGGCGRETGARLARGPGRETGARPSRGPGRETAVRLVVGRECAVRLGERHDAVVRLPGGRGTDVRLPRGRDSAVRPPGDPVSGVRGLRSLMSSQVGEVLRVRNG
ncbi:MraY family glycosyltransferase [Streptomyces mangrovisoli]|uniref:MraY family glycosyltransferase n=1 Tax=Streptomyces mangrovisoli TaxID=1428628 RepID=UPI00069676C8